MWILIKNIHTIGLLTTLKIFELPFTNLEIQKLEYVYGDKLKKYVLDKPSRVKDIKHIFRNRVLVQNEDVKDISNYPLLSSVPVFDVFNNKMISTYPSIRVVLIHWFIILILIQKED